MEVNSCYRMKVNSKAFAIPILTASAFIMFDTITVRIGIGNTLELTLLLYIATVEFYLQRFSILFDL